jgi:predicted enzyme related to lactoylglutathione lyase
MPLGRTARMRAVTDTKVRWANALRAHTLEYARRRHPAVPAFDRAPVHALKTLDAKVAVQSGTGSVATRHRTSEVSMSSTRMMTERATQIPAARTIDLKLEVVVIPVSDVDRAKRFYESLGWRLDADFTSGDEWRVVQLTPPGSACSIHFGKGVTTAVAGSVRSLYLVVSDMEAARGQLTARGVDVSEAFHFRGLGGPRVPGPDPEGRSYGTYASFSDPDGNGWLLQEITTRLPGRGFSNPDVANLAGLLREAETSHGEYGPTAPEHHWSEWYAAYIAARAQGRIPEDAAQDGALHVEGFRR